MPNEIKDEDVSFIENVVSKIDLGDAGNYNIYIIESRSKWFKAEDKYYTAGPVRLVKKLKTPANYMLYISNRKFIKELKRLNPKIFK